MQLKTRLKLLAIVGFGAITISLITINRKYGVELFSSKNFYQGLVMGIVLTALIIWMIALIVEIVKHHRIKDKETKLFSNKQFLLSIGMFSLVAGIFLSRYGGDSIYIDFVASILIGISIVFNLSYLHKYKRSST